MKKNDLIDLVRMTGVLIVISSAVLHLRVKRLYKRFKAEVNQETRWMLAAGAIVMTGLALIIVTG